jgi:hypothetical protein
MFHAMEKLLRILGTFSKRTSRKFFFRKKSHPYIEYLKQVIYLFIRLLC